MSIFVVNAFTPSRQVSSKSKKNNFRFSILIPLTSHREQWELFVAPFIERSGNQAFISPLTSLFRLHNIRAAPHVRPLTGLPAELPTRWDVSTSPQCSSHLEVDVRIRKCRNPFGLFHHCYHDHEYMETSVDRSCEVDLIYCTWVVCLHSSKTFDPTQLSTTTTTITIPTRADFLDPLTSELCRIDSPMSVRPSDRQFLAFLSNPTNPTHAVFYFLYEYRWCCFRFLLKIFFFGPFLVKQHSKLGYFLEKWSPFSHLISLVLLFGITIITFPFGFTMEHIRAANYHLPQNYSLGPSYYGFIGSICVLFVAMILVNVRSLDYMRHPIRSFRSLFGRWKKDLFIRQSKTW